MCRTLKGKKFRQEAESSFTVYRLGRKKQLAQLCSNEDPLAAIVLS
jgi:hypothetical protein